MKSEYQNLVIEKLKRIRESNNYSQAYVARCLGISPGQLGNIESYKRNHKYTLKQIYELSGLFNVPIGTIFSIGDKDAPNENINKLIELIIKYQDDKEKDKE